MRKARLVGGSAAEARSREVRRARKRRIGVHC
jgi:hypothetical protein